MEEEMSKIDTEFGLHLSSIFDPSAFDVADQRDPPAPNRVQPDQDQVHQNPSQPDEVEQNSSAADDTVQLVEDTRNAARLIYLQAERDFYHLMYRTLSHEVEAQSKNSSSWPISGSKIIALQNKAKVYIDELKALADDTTSDHYIPAIMPPNEESRMKNYSRDTFGYRIVSIDENMCDAPADNTTFCDNIPAIVPTDEDSRAKNVSFNTSGNNIVSTDEHRSKASAVNTAFDDKIPITLLSDEKSRLKNISFDTSSSQIVCADENGRKAVADNIKIDDTIPDKTPPVEKSRVTNVSFDTSSNQIVPTNKNKRKDSAYNYMACDSSYNIPAEYFSFDTSGYQIVLADENGRYRLPLVITSTSNITTAQVKKIQENWKNATLFTKIGDREIYHSDKIPIWDATNLHATKPELLKNHDSHKDDTFRNGFALPFDRICMLVFACRKNTCRYFRSVLQTLWRHEKVNEHGVFDTKFAKRRRNKSDEEDDDDETDRENQSQDEEEVFKRPRKAITSKRRCNGRSQSNSLSNVPRDGCRRSERNVWKLVNPPQTNENHILTIKLESCQ